VQRLELLDAVLPFQLVAGQARQFRERQRAGRGRKSRARQAAVERIGDRLQPAQHVTRFGAVDHRILVGQVDAGHFSLHQRAPDRPGLLAVAHQDRDIGGH
jgi:hypothetical protein